MVFRGIVRQLPAASFRHPINGILVETVTSHIFKAPTLTIVHRVSVALKIKNALRSIPNNVDPLVNQPINYASALFKTILLHHEGLRNQNAISLQRIKARLI